MKTKILFALAAGMFMMQSCNNDDHPLAQTDNVEAVLAAKYPSAKNVEWKTQGSYKVADFKYENTSTVAWFDQYAQWQMTETDIPYRSLPAAVKKAFESSEYATWRIEDVDKIERLNMETVYVIEVEKANKEVDLYYSPTGVLVKTVVDTDNDQDDSDDYIHYIPQQPTTGINKIIAQKYPKAKIVEVDHENGRIEVEIVDGNVRRDVYFDHSEKWLYTQTDVRVSSLPQLVVKAISTSYPGYRIDDAEYWETPAGNYFLLEIERGKSEMKVRVSPTGQIIR
ncbi:PepSY-like domain-containing protein [Tannerella sp.]|uniref:PepSY-like domain-containing protein n=1 Tax=Tannerella sp. TaxID=2382127 RepID=UPI0026DCE9D6|nr:PepSY-like domain-containing protein [Tannerella sp.]MDO4702313.1 PepSY-like domain-containing protein [Tannerella sp.]